MNVTKKPRWTELELALLREHIERGSTSADIAGAIERTPKAIQHKAACLGLPIHRRHSPPPGGIQRYRHTIEREFWARLDRATGCWTWPGWRDQDGYGRLNFDGRRYYAHRLAWALAVGTVPHGMFVLHRCDNPPCCNPGHLFLGTHRDNMADQVAKKRSLFGERNPRAKLTAAQVDEIRALLAERRLSQREIGIRFGVTQSAVSLIALGKKWAA